MRIDQFITGAAVDKLSEVLLLVGLDGSIIDANAAALGCYDYSRAEMLSLSVRDLVAPQEQGDPIEQMRRAAEHGTRFEVRHRRSDGTLFPVEVRPASGGAEGRTALVIIVRDTSDHARPAEAALPESESRYARSLIEASLDAFVAINPDGKISDVNRATEQATGMPRDRLIETDFAEYFTDPARARAGYERVLAEGAVRDYPLTLRNVSGSLMDVEYNATVYRDETGALRGVFAAARDVTDSKRARAQAARLAAIVTSTPDAVYAMEVDGSVTSWNPAAEAHFGYSAEEMIGASIAVLMPPGHEGESMSLIERVRAGERIAGFETQRRRKDGSVVDMALTLSPLLDDAGDVGEVSVISHDISERKQAEEARRDRLRFAEGLDGVNRAIQGTGDFQQTLSDVLGVVLTTLDCDRAWLFYPCDPDAPTFRVPMEVAKPEYPGAGALNVDIPMPPDMAENLREALKSAGPLAFAAGTDRPINKATAERFGVKSQMLTAIYPKHGKPWVFGMHQCSHLRIWTPEEKRLFQEIGRRLADGLTGLLAERELQQSELGLREAQRLAKIGSWDWDAATDTMTLSRECYRIFDIDPSRRLMGHGGVLRSYSPESAARMEAATQRTLRTGEPYILDLEQVGSDGARRWITARGEVKRDADETIVGLRGTVQDITERRQAEEELEFRNVVMSTQQEASMDGILIVDEEARILSYNRRFFELWQIPQQLVEAGIDEPVLRFVANRLADRDAFLERVRYLNDHRQEIAQDELVLADGRVFDRYSAPMLGPNERYYGRVWYFRDITERRAAEERLRQLTAELERRVRERTGELNAANEELRAANEDLSEANVKLEEATGAKNGFLASMSHELRTPLNSIIGFSGVLLQGLSGPLGDEQARQVAMINNSGRHLLELINEILDLAKIESGGNEPAIESVDVGAVAREMWDTVKPLAEAKGLKMRWQCPDAMRPVQTDGLRVGQILLNLMGNAVKFTEHGYVGAIVSRDETGVTVAVEDSGCGIAAEDEGRVFDDFYQVTPRDSGKSQGTGLGLAVSRRLADSIGARIELNSELGRGSVFTLRIPGSPR